KRHSRFSSIVGQQSPGQFGNLNSLVTDKSFLVNGQAIGEIVSICLPNNQFVFFSMLTLIIFQIPDDGLETILHCF
ncbi:MAG: hypothetical protein V3R33_04675, partial [Anaerolineales bacterium]